MTEFDDLDAGTAIRFKHFFDQVERKVAEGKVTTVIQTSVGKAYKIRVEEDYLGNDRMHSPVFVTPDQVVDVLDYEVLYRGESWKLLKSDSKYFFDPLNAEPVPIESSEISEAVTVLEGDSE